MTTAVQSRAVRTVSASVAAIAASLAFPFLVHLLPAGEGVRLGSTLLPIFWAPLLAALVFGPVPAFASAALAPWVNHWLTGLPPQPALVSITLELLAFAALVLLLMRALPRNPVVAPLAYAVAHVAVQAGFWATGGMPEGAWASLGGSFVTGLPGVFVLLLVNLAAVSLRRREGRG